MPTPTLSQRIQIAAKAAMGLFDNQSGKQLHGMLDSIFPSGGGDSPERGTAQQIDAYNYNPWLRAVTNRIATSVAATSNSWKLFAPTSKKKRDVAMVQRGMVPHVRKEAIEKKLRDGDLVEVDSDHLFLQTLHKANDYHVGGSLFKVTQLHMDLVGEAFWGIDRNSLGAPIAFWPIPSHWVKELPTPQSRFYRVSFRGWQVGIPDTEMVWMADPNPSNPYSRGTGHARALADELELDEYAAKHVKQFFYNRARPDLIVYPKQQGPQDTGLRSAEVDRLEEAWLSKHAGLWRAFKPFFVGREVGVHEINQDFQSMQMNELRLQQRDTVLQQFGIPPEQMGIVENSNRATITASDFLYHKNVIVPRMEFLRAQLQERVIPQYDERLVLEYVSPVEEDHDHHLQVAIASPHSLTVDEWRDMMGKDQLEDEAGDVHAMTQAVRMVRDLGEEADREPDPILIPGLPGEPPVGEHRPGSLLADDKPKKKPKPKDDEDDDKGWFDGAGDDYGNLTKSEPGLDDEGDPLPPLSRRVARHERARRAKMFSALDTLSENADVDAIEEAVSRGRQVDRVADAVDYESWEAQLEDEHQDLAYEAYWVGVRMAAHEARIAIQRDADGAVEKTGSRIQFNKVNPRAVDYAKSRSLRRVESITTQSRAAIRLVLQQSLNEGWGAKKTALRIKHSLSLTPAQNANLLKLFEKWDAAGTTTQNARRWRRRAIRARAQTIARTELIAASNMGQQELWQQGISNGQLPSNARRKWITAVDGRQDLDCEMLNNTVVDMNEEFKPGVLTPPLHPNCRCAIGLVRPAQAAIVEPPASAAWPLDDSAVRGWDSKVRSDALAKYDGWGKGLLRPEERAVNSYSKSGYQTMNNYLRHPNNFIKDDPFTNRVRSSIRNLDSALAKAPKPPPPELVWRGVRDTLDRYPVGKEIRLDGYQSTSINPSAAKSFAGGREQGVIFEIRASDGSYIESLSGHSRELEFLLPQGRSYKVVKHAKVKMRFDTGTTERLVVQLEQLPIGVGKSASKPVEKLDTEIVVDEEDIGLGPDEQDPDTERAEQARREQPDKFVQPAEGVTFLN